MTCIAYRPVRSAAVAVLLSLCGAPRAVAQAIDLSRRAVSYRSSNHDSTLVLAHSLYSVADVPRPRSPELTQQCSEAARIATAFIYAASGALFGYTVSKIPDGGTRSGTRIMTSGGAVVGMFIGLARPLCTLTPQRPLRAQSPVRPLSLP
ncbi:hypothetical protein BH09GEM1_BH09GEM1_05220 [soil metagenome]